MVAPESNVEGEERIVLYIRINFPPSQHAITLKITVSPMPGKYEDNYLSTRMCNIVVSVLYVFNYHHFARL